MWPMARLFVQNLAIYKNENLAISLKIWNMLNKAFKNVPNTYKISPKLQNFIKSGHSTLVNINSIAQNLNLITGVV